jgi:hypothetical protein
VLDPVAEAVGRLESPGACASFFAEVGFRLDRAKFSGLAWLLHRLQGMIGKPDGSEFGKVGFPARDERAQYRQ